MHNNVIQALLGAFDGDGDGKMSFNEFVKLHKQFPQLLHPAFRIQDSIAQKTMGREWWASKKDYFAKSRNKDAKAKEREKEKAKQEQINRQKRQIRRKMGIIQYYLNCPKRRKYLAQIVVIDPEEEERKLEAARREEAAKNAAEQERMWKAKQAKGEKAWYLKDKERSHVTGDSPTAAKKKVEGRSARRKARKDRMSGNRSPGRSSRGSGHGKRTPRKVKKRRKVRDA